QAEDGIRVFHVTGVQTCALPISSDIDPAIRLLMEATWEALEGAGCNPQAGTGGIVGLFVGGGASRYPSASPLGSVFGRGASMARSEERRGGTEWSTRVVAHDEQA